VPIYASSDRERTCQRLCFWRGVHPCRLERCDDLVQMFDDATRDLLRRDLVRPDDAIVFLGDAALTQSSSNTLKIHVVTPDDARRARRRE
jgi:pyruvate kinase